MAEAQKKNFYHLMLNLPEDVTSPDHYELLGLEHFEDGPDVIKDATLDANQKLLAWQNSDYHRDCDHLIGEVVRARAVLLDVKRKAKYDGNLRQRLGFEVPPGTPEEPDEEIALAPLPPSRAELRRRATEEREADEAGPDFGKLFLWGLAGVVAVAVLVGVVVVSVSSLLSSGDSQQSSDDSQTDQNLSLS